MESMKWESAHLENPSDNGGSKYKRSSSSMVSEPEKRQEKDISGEEGGDEAEESSSPERWDWFHGEDEDEGEKLNDGEGDEGMEGYYCIQETWRCIEMRLRSWASTTECSKRIT